MRYRAVAICVFFGLTLAGIGLADSLTLKDGRVINGTYLGGSSRQIRMEVGDNIQTFEVDRVANIQFGAGSTASAAPARQSEESDRPSQPRERVDILRPDSSSRRESDSSRSGGVELPAGTVVTVRMVDPVDSEVNRIGETFRANRRTLVSLLTGRRLSREPGGTEIGTSQPAHRLHQ